MSNAIEPAGDADPGHAMQPLPGEPGIPDVAERSRAAWSKKGIVAAVLLIGSLVAVAALSIQRFTASGKKADAESRLAGDRPAAATAEPRRLELSTPASAPTAKPAGPRIPAIEPTAEELAEPIGVRRTGQGGAPASPNGTRPIPPEDAPAVLVSTRPGAARGESRKAPQAGTPADRLEDTAAPGDPLDDTRRNLQAYQQQLRGLMDSLTQSAATATKQDVTGVPPAAAGLTSAATGSASPTGLFGGQLQGSATPRVTAGLLGNRSLTLPKGTAFTCALKTKVISATSGLVGCQVQRNVYGDDGRVLLVERGSHLDGEYRIGSVRPGMVRIPVLWTRIRTPHGVTVDIDSPGTGPLGESGIDGYVDNRWSERIGAAMLLSLIDDAVKLTIQNQASEGNADTVILPSTTSNTSKLAEKVLDSTINIPPLIYQNQGGIVGIYVARDVDFSTVYELQPVPR
jgi:type IV secretion system protein VirB10